MMKKVLSVIIAMLIVNPIYAGDETTLSLHIAENIQTNNYFFCIYDVGCLSIKAGNHGKTFDIPPMDMGNIIKFVITDARSMQEFMVPSNPTCNLTIKSGQKLAINGRLTLQHGKPTIKNLSCHLA